MKAIIVISVYWFILIFTLASCNSKTTESQKCSSLKVSESIEIEVEAKQYLHQSYQIIDIDDSPFLYGLDIPNKTIDVFDLKNGEFHHQIDYSAEKLNIIEIDQFYVHNQDSVFLFSIPLNTLYLIDNESNLSDIWEFDLDYENPKPNLYAFNVLAFHNYFNRFIYDNKAKKFISTIFFFDGQNFLNENAYNFPSIGRFKLTSEKQIPDLSGEFPQSYFDFEVPYDMFYSMEKKGENLLLNYSFSSNVYDEKNDTIYDIKSKHEAPIKTYPKGQDPDIDKVVEDINQGLVYLKTFELDNGKLIRVCKLPQPLENESGLKNEFIQSPWSVIVYDKSSNEVLNEYCFEANKHHFRHILPDKNGFYVLKENPFEELNNEEILEIQYFAIN